MRFITFISQHSRVARGVIYKSAIDPGHNLHDHISPRITPEYTMHYRGVLFNYCTEGSENCYVTASLWISNTTQMTLMLYLNIFYFAIQLFNLFAVQFNSHGVFLVYIMDKYSKNNLRITSWRKSPKKRKKMPPRLSKSGKCQQPNILKMKVI